MKNFITGFCSGIALFTLIFCARLQADTSLTITNPISLGQINTVKPVFLYANFKESKAIAKYELGNTDNGVYTLIKENEYQIAGANYEGMKTAFANTDFTTVTLEQFALGFLSSLDPSMAGTIAVPTPEVTLTPTPTPEVTPTP